MGLKQTVTMPLGGAKIAAGRANTMADEQLVRYLALVDRFLGGWKWIPFYYRSIFRLQLLRDVTAAHWFFAQRFQELDKLTPDDLKKKYKEELPHWHDRFDELKKAVHEAAFRVYQIWSLLIFLPIVLGVSALLGTVITTGVTWIGGIPILVGSSILGWIAMSAVAALLLQVRVYPKLREFADVLLVNSLLKVLLELYSPDKPTLQDRQDKKKMIIGGLEASARWLRVMALQCPSGDKKLKGWYRERIDKAINNLLDQREAVIKSKTGDSDSLRIEITEKFDWALRCEYGCMIPEGVPPSEYKPKRRDAEQYLVNGVTFAFTVAFITLATTGSDLSYFPALLGGTGFMAFLGFAYEAIRSGKAEDMKAGTEVFLNFMSRIK